MIFGLGHWQKTIACGAIVIELSIPLLLALGTDIGGFLGVNMPNTLPILNPLLGGSDPATLVRVGLVIMIIFHCFIISNFPLAMPLEWNIVHIFTGFFLFGVQHGIPITAISNPLLISAIFIMIIAVPQFGSIFPQYISFLAAMRYYAGNWPIGIWLVKDKVEAKIEKNIRKVSPNIARQLSILRRPPDAVETSYARILAFRSLHLLTRGVHTLIPKAVDDIDEYQWREGELMCAHILGWSFGDGHLHNEELITSLQKTLPFQIRRTARHHA